VRYLLTMNMPSAKGYAVHQLTVDHPAPNINEFMEELQDNEFIMCTLMYRVEKENYEREWQDRGKMIINTSVVGKAQEYYPSIGDF